MFITADTAKARQRINSAKEQQKKVGFVPTMGTLHAGHLSLVQAARKDCRFVVASIFVNPLQFGPGEDYKKYPRNFSRDESLLKKAGVDLIFYPRAKTMYAHKFSTYIEEAFSAGVLCAKSRPGHFRGVCTVVGKLFNIIQPDVAYFGQKDYQQAQIIKKMAKDLNFPVQIKVLPIVREPDGLASSSRNTYLKASQRKEALALFAALKLAELLIKSGEGNPRKIISRMRALIKLHRLYRNLRRGYFRNIKSN